ncbi:MAG: serine/threonine-protein kinase [Planctomycetota bacterium]
MLSAGKWRQVRKIFEEALDRHPGERHDFVATACLETPELLPEVEVLLEAHKHEDRFLTPPGGFGSVSGLDPLLDGPPLRERIGPYRLIRLIGTGGMGSVYEAEQESPHRKVALKTLRFGLNDRDALRRFRYETEILGRLRHPNVAQIFEAGTFQEGPGGAGQQLPYFAMDYIEDGLPLTEYAEREKLPLRERLALFQQVCDGVQHAHQKGIIHRDLKPGNILVDPAGHPRVIDFGVARAEAGAIDLTVDSLSGKMVGTLQTMSPEQVDISGEVDIRSDVYSLGMILYRLVCGVYPYSLDHVSLTEVARIIHHEPPRAPRSALPAIDRDLEWILLRALEKEKERRYATASELKADLQRYLSHEPVQAGPPSGIYRLRKYVRRHPARTGMLVLLLLGSVGTLFGLIRAQQANRRANTARLEALDEARRASAIAAFTSHILLSPTGYRTGKDSRVSDLLDEAAVRLEQEGTGDDRVEAQLHYLLGAAFVGLTDYQRAEPHLRRARELFERDLGPDHPSTLESSTSLGNCLSGLGRGEEAERLLSKTLDRMRTVLGENHRRTLQAEATLGHQLYLQGRFEESEALLRHAANQLEQSGPGLELELYSALSNLAGVVMAQGRYEEADGLLARVAEGRERLLPEDHHSVLNTANTRAALLKRRGRPEEARALYARILEIRRRALPPRHAATLLSMINLAAAEQELGNSDHSVELLSEALAVLREDHPASDLTLGAAYNLASSLRAAGRLEEALPLYEESLRLATTILPAGNSRIPATRLRLGICLVELERFQQAEPHLLQAYEELQAAGPAEEQLLKKTLETLVTFYERWDRPAERERWNRLLMEQDSGSE